MAFVGILSQIKLIFGPLVIQLVWYILKQLFTSVSVKVVDIYFDFGVKYRGYYNYIHGGVFHDFSKISEKFPKLSRRLHEMLPNIFQKLSRLPKIAEGSRGRPENVSMIHQRIEVKFKRQTVKSSIPSPVRIWIFLCIRVRS